MATRLEAIRRNRKQSQRQLAKPLGLTQSLLSLIESRRLQPTRMVLVRLASELGVPAECLLDEVEIHLEGR